MVTGGVVSDTGFAPNVAAVVMSAVMLPMVKEVTAPTELSAPPVGPT